VIQTDIDFVVRMRIANLLVIEGLVEFGCAGAIFDYKHMAIAQAQGPSM
jgi:hypothetical protein